MPNSLIFLEEPHKYYVVEADIPPEARDFVTREDYVNLHGEITSQPLKSVTTFVGQFENHFIAEDVLDKMFANTGEIYDGSQINIGKNPEYQGCTREEVQQLWDIKREKACRYGTWVHKEAEEYCLGNRNWTKFGKNKERPEFNQIVDFFDSTGMECVETEIRVFDAEYQMAGTLDLLLKGPDGKYYIGDWKTNDGKDLTDMQGDYYTKGMQLPVSNLKDLPYWHYALQFSMYRYLLEKNEGMEFGGQFAIHIKREGNKAEVIQMPYLKAEVERLLVIRSKEIEQSL